VSTKVKPGYKQAEVGMIPDDWDLKRLGDLAEVSAGGTPDRANPRYWNGDVPWVTTSEVDFCTITCAGQFITKEGLSNSAAKLLPPGTILMALYGQGKTRGKVGVLGIEAATNQACAAIRLRRPVDGAFVFCLLASQYEAIRNLSNTGNQENLNGSIVRSIPILLPPEPEQRAIAEALSDADALIESREQLIAKKRHLKQGAMQELLTGKRRLPGFSGEWGVKRLGDIADADPENLGSDTPGDFAFNYIALEDVDRGTLRGYSERFFHSAPSRARRKLREGDVLVSTVRPSLQSHLLFSAHEGNWVCSTGFCVVRCRKGVSDPGFVYFQVFGDHVARQIEALLTGSNYPAINSGDVRALEVPVPSYTEQTAIAAVLSDMDAEIAALETKLAKARQVKQGMMQELLTGRIRLL